MKTKDPDHAVLYQICR